MTGAFPALDFIGWAFTTLGKFNFFGHGGLNVFEYLIMPLIVIALLIWPTLWLFSKLQRLKSQRNQLVIVFGLLAIVVLWNLSTLMPSWYDLLNQFAPFTVYAVLLYGVNNFIFWTGVIILPTYFIYPEIREQNLRRVVTVCFILTGILRYGSEYLISFTPASGLYSAIYQPWHIFAGYYLVMLPVTVGFAFVSYWIIHEVMQRVPPVGRWFSSK